MHDLLTRLADEDREEFVFQLTNLKGVFTPETTRVQRALDAAIAALSTPDDGRPVDYSKMAAAAQGGVDGWGNAHGDAYTAAQFATPPTARPEVDIHASDCATHNEPAMRNGVCDCLEPLTVAWISRSALAVLQDPSNDAYSVYAELHDTRSIEASNSQTAENKIRLVVHPDDLRSAGDVDAAGNAQSLLAALGLVGVKHPPIEQAKAEGDACQHRWKVDGQHDHHYTCQLCGVQE